MEGPIICLSDLCELVSDPVDPATRPADLYLGLEHLASGRLVPTGVGQASDVRSSKSSFQPGDIIYGKIRNYLDKVVLVDKKGICTTEMLVLRAKSGVERRFLAAVVHSPDFVQYAIAGTKGVQHPRTSWAHIREFNMPEFTSDEQRRMADLLWAVHDSMMVSEALIESGQDLKRATVRLLFTRGLRGEPQKETEIGPIPANWNVKPLSDCACKPYYGYTASASNEPVGTRLLRITDSKDGSVDWGAVPDCNCNKEIIESKGLNQHDIVVARIGATTGKSFLIDNCPEAVFVSYLIRIRQTKTKSIPIIYATTCRQQCTGNISITTKEGD